MPVWPPRWAGPCKVVARLGPETYSVKRPGLGLAKYHVRQIKLYTAPEDEQGADGRETSTGDATPDSREPSPAGEDKSPATPAQPRRGTGRPRKAVPPKMTPSPQDEHLHPGHNHDLRKRLGGPTRLARHISSPVNCACLWEGGV
jgi:hypothetical protein